MKKGMTPHMVTTFYRIQHGYFSSVDLSSAKALEKRGLVRIHRVYTPQGKEVTSARKYEALVSHI